MAYGDLGTNSFFPDWIDALKTIEELDFDILLVAHGHYGKASGFGTVGTKADLVLFRQYFEALYEAVYAAKENGLSLEQTVETIDLDEFSDMDMYDKWFKLNVKGMYLNSPGPD